MNCYIPALVHLFAARRVFYWCTFALTQYMLRPLRFLIILTAFSRLITAHGQCVVINEVLVNPTDACDGQCQPSTAEWTELYNTCDVPVDIGCFVLADGDWALTIPAGTVLAAGGYFVIGSLNSNAPVDLDISTCNCTSGAASQIGVFTNSAEQIALIDPDGNFVDAIYWGAGQFSNNPFNVSAGAGCSGQSVVINAAATDWFLAASSLSTDGSSIARDCDGSATWLTVTSGYTPGASNNGTPPMAVFSASTTGLCAGECTSFSYDGLGSPEDYSWTFEGSSTFTSSASSPTGICYTLPGSYSVTLEVSNNCGSDLVTISDYITITASEVPVIISSSNTVLCEGETALLEVNGAGPYQWLADDVPLPGETAGQLTVAATGSYTVQTVGGSCVSESDPWDVLFIDMPDPVVSFLGDGEVCEGETLLLQAPVGMELYQWFEDGVLLPDVSSAIEVSATGIYVVTIYQQLCSVTSEPVAVVMIPTPQVSLAVEGPGVICPGVTTQLQATQGYDSYTWIQNGAALSVTVNDTFEASTAGTYEVEVLDGNGCSGASNAVEVALEIPSPPVIELDGDGTVCVGETLQLTAVGNFDQWQWFLGSDVELGATDESVDSQGNSVWSVQGTTIDGCIAMSETVFIQELPLPGITLSAFGEMITCNETYSITATSDESIIEWQWLEDGALIPGALTSSLTVLSDGIFQAFGTTSEGCIGSSELVTISFLESIEVEIITSDSLPCEGDIVQLSTDESYAEVLWNDGSTEEELATVTSGEYSVEVMDTNGCRGEASIDLTFQTAPEIQLPEAVVSDCSEGAPLVAISDAEFFAWTPLAGLSSNNTASSMANPNRTTVYTVTATTGGCSSTAVVRVEVDCSSVFIPNSFTPNGDGINDYFQVVANGVEDFEIVVCNRWGEVVYRSIDPEEKWTGGKDSFFVPDGVYTYRVKALDGNGIPIMTEAHVFGCLFIMR
jgi:gliding motility-associated-like protein